MVGERSESLVYSNELRLKKNSSFRQYPDYYIFSVYRDWSFHYDLLMLRQLYFPFFNIQIPQISFYFSMILSFLLIYFVFLLISESLWATLAAKWWSGEDLMKTPAG